MHLWRTLAEVTHSYIHTSSLLRAVARTHTRARVHTHTCRAGFVAGIGVVALERSRGVEGVKPATNKSIFPSGAIEDTSRRRQMARVPCLALSEPLRRLSTTASEENLSLVGRERCGWVGREYSVGYTHNDETFEGTRVEEKKEEEKVVSERERGREGREGGREK